MADERLDKEKILNWGYPGRGELIVFSEIDSTNTYAKENFEGLPNGTMIVSEMQTKGRGRRGRYFYSPKGTGLYISIILKNSGQSFDSTRLTITSAVSVIKAIREASCVSPDIKWVNDIYLDGRKIGGILCEAVSDASGSISGYIAGIGINCFDSDFPEDIKAKAGAINDPLLSRNRLASLIRSHLLTDIMLPAEEITEAYRSHSFLIGRDISYNDNGLTVMARVLDIGDDGRLHVARDDGTEDLLDSGEISVIPNSKDNT